MKIQTNLIDPPPNYDDSVINEITESIRSQGLINPITVHSMNGRYRLVAGGKRLAALIKLNYPEVEASIIEGDLADDKLQEIHIHENLKRHNMPWFEQVELVEQLHELRQTQKGRPTLEKGGGGKKTGWSLRDTAKELTASLGSVSQDLNLARVLKVNPTLKNIKDKATAAKVAKQYMQRAAMEEDSIDIPSIVINDVLNGSSAEILKAYEKYTFDACITDPPWLKYIDKTRTYDSETLPVFSEIYRVLKANAIMYVFAGVDDFTFYRTELVKIGFKVQQWPSIWIKRGVITHGLRPWEYTRDFEMVLVACKGTPANTSTKQLSSLFEYPPIHSTKLRHPHEKPVDLIENLIGHCSYENGIILDPFAGSGVVGEAARNLQRNYLLIERDHSTYKKIKERLK